MTEQMKPCNHCSESDNIEIRKARIYDHYYGYCTACGQRGVTCSSKKEAVEEWNTRPEEARLIVVIEAQGVLIDAALNYVTNAGEDDQKDEKLFNAIIEAEQDLLAKLESGLLTRQK